MTCPTICLHSFVIVNRYLHSLVPFVDVKHILNHLAFTLRKLSRDLTLFREDQAAGFVTPAPPSS